MKSKRLILGFAVFALIVGYIELRLPEPVAAQGRDAVFQRLGTGVLKFETPLTPTITARLAASGTASASTYLRGDGSWNDPLEAFRGQISAFNGPCPTDWNEVTALRGRMIVGLVDGGTLAGTRGTVLTDLERRRGGTVHPADTQHYSTSTSTIRLPLITFPSPTGTRLETSTSVGGLRISPSASSRSKSLNQLPPAPYIQFRYCEYQP